MNLKTRSSKFLSLHTRKSCICRNPWCRIKETENIIKKNEHFMRFPLLKQPFLVHPFKFNIL